MLSAALPAGTGSTAGSECRADWHHINGRDGQPQRPEPRAQSHSGEPLLSSHPGRASSGTWRFFLKKKGKGGGGWVMGANVVFVLFLFGMSFDVCHADFIHRSSPSLELC